MRIVSLAALLLSTTAPAATPWIVSPQSVRAHEAFLAGDALRGRGSATPPTRRSRPPMSPRSSKVMDCSARRACRTMCRPPGW